MSNFEAVGGVSATLQALIRDRMELPPDVSQEEFRVTVSVPPQFPSTQTEPSRVNLFLYRILENGHLRNRELPGQGQEGAYGSPPLSLDLNYLLTAYGTTNDEVGAVVPNETRAHFLLGSAMRVLHDFPVITEDLKRIREQVGEPVLHPSLQGQTEQIRLYLESISLEDLSKVWTALTLPFRSSAAYKVSVVQIESQRRRRYAPLVREPPSKGPRVFVVPIRTPQIDSLGVRRIGAIDEQPYPFARVGDTLVIHGRNFGTRPLRVRIGALEVAATPTSDTQIELVVPDDGAIPDSRRLEPGVQPLEVILPIDGLRDGGFSSNRAAFLLAPLLNSVSFDAVVVPRTMTVTGKRLFASALTGETLVGDQVIPKGIYKTAVSEGLTMPLPDTLPASRVDCLVSNSIGSLAGLPTTPKVRVKIDADQFRLAEFPNSVTTVEEAADGLQSAIRGASIAAGYRGTRVGLARRTVGGGMEKRLVLVPGNLRGSFEFKNAPGDQTADILKLTPPPSPAPSILTTGYQSGPLEPFPVLSARNPVIRLSNPARQWDVPLGASPPATLSAARDAFQASLNSLVSATAQAAILGRQLFLVLGVTPPFAFSIVPGVDETTAADLELRVQYPVRVRVNGVESLDVRLEEMPPP